MAHPHRFRFGIQAATASSAAEWAALARQVEDLGYSTLFVPDHFGDQLAPIPALTAAAGATTDLRVGTLVLDNDFRHPAVLAKEVATLDLLSDGRVEVGIGAGWQNSDYVQSGIPKEPAGLRISRMEEALHVMKGCFAEGPFSFEGEHYRISGLDGQPLPHQRPHPPILIGGGGRRVLSIAAREAQIVGINFSIPGGEIEADVVAGGTAERTDEKLRYVREAAGDRFEELELNVLVFACVVTDDRRGVAEAMGPAFGLTPEDVLDFPHAVIGSVEQICDDLRARRERWGVSYWVFQADAVEPLAPVVAALHGT